MLKVIYFARLFRIYICPSALAFLLFCSGACLNALGDCELLNSKFSNLFVTNTQSLMPFIAQSSNFVALLPYIFCPTALGFLALLP